MRTASLRRRVVLAGVITLLAVLVPANLFVYASLSATLHEALRDALADRVELARDFAETRTPTELAAALSRRGVRATVHTEDGSVLSTEPALPRLGTKLPSFGSGKPQELISQHVELEDGAYAIVSVSREGADATLRRVLQLQILTSIAAMGLGAVVLARAAGVALRPVDSIISLARAIAAGKPHGRLGPDNNSTEIGRMAVAFDEMLDAQEKALEQARESDERSHRFLSDAAHQLRTPIAGIQASVETISRVEDPETRERLLSNLSREAARAGHLVDELLKLARMDQGAELER